MYDIIFFIGLVLYLPFYARRKKINLAALKEKFGHITRTKNEASIWIQVVSVGEVILVGEFIKRLRQVYNYPIVITTTTLTGNAVAKKKYSSYATIFFFPFDLSLVLERVLRIIRPKIFIAAETEVWPNLFHRLRQKHIPIVIVNGRISDKAFRRYRLARPITKLVMRQCNFVGAQNQHYKKRFLALGCKEEHVMVSGNMKFESISIDDQYLAAIKEKYMPILRQNASLVLIAGSTHEPEEEMLLRLYKNFAQLEEKISLIIAPRHIERVPVIEKIAASFGIKTLRLSTHTKSQTMANVFLLDTIGELLYFYSLSDICVVGGSFVPHGGQNILEPVYFLKPTIFGPSMNNFKDIEEIILAKGAGIQAKDEKALEEAILALIKNPVLRQNLRIRCMKVFEDERKSLDENLKLVIKSLN